tara:strand:- start:301 stop:1113 length:813 start_codon:yes stop_codon:yes gene_type:complete
MIIRDTGKVYKFDENDCIIAHHNKLETDPKWEEAIKDLLNRYDKTNIHSIYIRGSVATDWPVDGVSDLDILLVFNIKTHIEDIFPSYTKFMAEHFKYHQYMVKTYPFIKGVDFSRPIDAQRIGVVHRFLIKHLSVCIYGKNLQSKIPKFKKDEILNLDIRYKDLERGLDDIENGVDKMRSFCRGLIRVGFSLVNQTINTDIWTRDLFQCQKYFSEAYPERRKEIERIFEIACLDNSTEKERELVIGFSYWLKDELLKNNLELNPKHEYNE